MLTLQAPNNLVDKERPVPIVGRELHMHLIVDQSEYARKEAEYARDAIAPLLSRIEDLEKYALLTTGAIWAWAVANNTNHAVKLLLWAPLVIQSLLAFRALIAWKNAKLHMDYLAALETEMGVPPGLGVGHAIYVRWKRLAEQTGGLFWLTLFIISLLVVLLVPFVGRQGCTELN